MNDPEFKLLFDKSLAVARELIRAQDRTSQSFRDRFEHTLRVLTWARRIQPLEGGDMKVISLAVLFHDTGWSEEINHADVSAQLVEKFLLENRVKDPLAGRIISAVRTHNLREIPSSDLPIENRIVMDADLLDELGITTLIWDAMSVAQRPGPGYYKVLEKSCDFYASALGRTSELKTRTGSVLYGERMDAWKQALDHLVFELGTSPE